MLDNANLIKKTRFPRQLVPLSIVAAHLVSYAVMLALLLALDFALLPRTRATEWLAIPLAALFVSLGGGRDLSRRRGRARARARRLRLHARRRPARSRAVIRPS